MQVTLLGTGSSAGVPMIGCDCAVCTSNNLKNKRTRASIAIQSKKSTILVDTSPDLRQQALDNHINRIDAIIYTHAHADHTHGVDEVRSFNYLGNKAIDAYGDTATFEEIQIRFDYAFMPPIPEYGWYKPQITPHIIKAGDVIKIQDITVETFAQLHGKGDVLGLKFGNMAYSTDVNNLPEASIKKLKGIDTWIVDCLSYKQHPTHAHLDLVFEWIKEIQPKRAILTHLNHEMEYEELSNSLPKNIEVGYDGMVIKAH